MASDASTPGETEVMARRRRDRKEQEDIEELTSTGHRALQEGRTQDALRCFRQAVKAAQQLQDSRVLRACSFNLGAAYVEVGRPHKGLDFLQRAQSGPKADRLPDLQFNLALAHNALGQSQEAAAHFLQAAQLYRCQGDAGSEGDACMEMSRCYSTSQDWALAVSSFLRAAESYRVAAMLDSAATALKEAGHHMMQSDQFSRDDITGVLTECLSLTDSITDPRTLGELYLSVGVAYCCLRCFPEAIACLQQAQGPASAWPHLLAKVLHNLGAALNSVRSFSPAVSVHRQAASLYGSLGCRGDQARCFSNLAFACSQLGDEDEAAESFILALQGFRDTDDHLAQVQVCEALAACYLRQRKQHRAVQVYQQALSAAALCQDDSGRVRDRLVEQLTAALAPPTGLQRSHPRRQRPVRPHPHSSPVERKSDITQSPEAAANQQQEDQRGRGPGRWEAAEHCGSADAPEHRNMEPAPHSSHLSEQMHSELWSDREVPPTDSEASLVQETEAPPTSPGNIREAPPPVSRWRSRFCSLM